MYLLLSGGRKKEEEKTKKKKLVTSKIQKSSKVFVSDDSAAEYKEEPSTSIRVESSGKEAVPKKKGVERMLERIESSSDEEETGDKIFFEMYQKYQNS